ncbi:MAG: polysaccharide deacetylase family protein [Desulfococcaceae bacterium]|jgi:hypothetical protein|nr:polysaccharide deacetylase family protein [Desulfococcaceae bacterium]
MKYSPSVLWQSPTDELIRKTGNCLEEVLDRRGASAPVVTFFRADDIGVPGRKFTRLMEIFQRHRVPLSLAVVPMWLYKSRWQTIRSLCGTAPSLCCWHQHGRMHRNYAPEGEKKQEFGPNRSAEDIRKDLAEGKKRLENIMGKDFYPVFTPPWNRCSAETLRLLEELSYKAVSGMQDARFPASPRLPNPAVNTDLHTRKEKDIFRAQSAFLAEIGQAAAGGFWGLMIHHQRMNDAAFAFLDGLLPRLKKSGRFRLMHFRDMLEMPDKSALP